LADAVVRNGRNQSSRAGEGGPGEAGIDPFEAITDGLAKGMENRGTKYESGEYFIPQLLVWLSTP